MESTNQEIAPLIENDHQPLDLEIDVPEEYFEPVQDLENDAPEPVQVLEIDIPERVQDLETDNPEEYFEPVPDCLIYKVPRRYRAANEKDYTPQYISIGPLHHDDKNLAPMEKEKQRYYNKFLTSTSEETVKKINSYMDDNINRIRKCYDVEFVCEAPLESDKFADIISHDAVFIIEFLLRHFEKKINDFILEKEWLDAELQIDLVLLENQLPYFVLEDLYKLAFAASHKTPFLVLACKYLGISVDKRLYKMGIKHFTDLLRYDLVNNGPKKDEEGNTIHCKKKKVEEGNANMYTATKLHEAGVKFRKADGDSLFDVKFENGVLEIPFIEVMYSTETRYRNVMACEQCHYRHEAYFCSFIQLLDSLVDTEKDVDLLVKEKIIVNKLGSNAAVAEMINNLAIGVVNSCLIYGKIGSDLNKYYKNSWNRRCATLKHVYFNNLWRGTATSAAFIAVILTLAQTVLAILERAMPTKN